MPLFSPKIPHGLAWDTNHSAKVRVLCGLTSSIFIVPQTLENKQHETEKPKVFGRLNIQNKKNRQQPTLYYYILY
jgi:hypothetical protein